MSYNKIKLMLSNIFRHRVSKNVGALSFLQIFSYLIPLIVLIHLTRVLGVELYGVVVFSASLIQLASVFLDFGFTLSATQKISVWRNKKRSVARLLGSIFIIKFVLYIVAATVILIYASFSHKYESFRYVFYFSLLPLLGLCFQSVWFFLGIEKMRDIAFFMIISKLLYLIFIFIFVTAEGDYYLVPVVDGCAQILTAVLGIYLIYRSGYSFQIPKVRDIKYSLKMTFGFFMSRLAVATYVNGGVILLGFFGSPTNTAIYSIAERFYQAMQQVFAPIVQAIYPYMVKERNIRLWWIVTIASIIFACVLSGVLFILMPHLLPLIVDTNHQAIMAVMNIFFFTIIFNVMVMMAGYPLAAALNCINVANTTVIYGAAAYFLCVLVFYKFTDLTPVMFATAAMVSEIFVLLVRVFLLGPKAYKNYLGMGKSNN